MTLVVDATEFLVQVRRILFSMYQASQRLDMPDRYHFGIRAREVARGLDGVRTSFRG